MSSAPKITPMSSFDDLLDKAIEAGLLKRETVSQAEVTLGRGRMYLREACPWFRPLLLKLVPRWVPKIGTIAVTRGALLLIDPEFVAGIPDEEMAFLLAHELMHLLDQHAERLGARGRGAWNCACDRAINGILVDIPALKMPSGDRAGLMPADIGKANGLTADEYFQEPDQQNQDGDQKPRGKTAQGACGGCAGNPVEGEPDDAGDPEARTESELSRAARNVAEGIVDAAEKSQGTVPAGLRRIAQGMLAPPRVDWRKLLAAEIRSAVQWASGHTHHRWDAPSRRQGAVGFGAGKPILPRLRQPVPTVACLVDTSGSMSEGDLGACVRETAGILRAVGTPVDLCVCDAQVHGLRPVRDWKEVLQLLSGGGGSDFNPAFIELEKRRPQPSVVVALTDGMISVPTLAPHWCRVIWVVIGKDREAPVGWGRCVHVDD